MQSSKRGRKEAGVGGVCAYCLFPIKPGQTRVVCPECQTVHHAECWEENRGCSTYGCARAPSAVQPEEAEAEAEEAICNYCHRSITSGQGTRRCVFCDEMYHARCWLENGGCSTPGCQAAPSGEMDEHYRPHESTTTHQQLARELAGKEGPAAEMCPHCGGLIDPEDAVRKCPFCDTVHHSECWLSEGGCSTEGCQAQNSLPKIDREAIGNVTKCPYCGVEIKPGEERQMCMYCGAAHHQDCWRENSGCAVYGCQGGPSHERAEDVYEDMARGAWQKSDMSDFVAEIFSRPVQYIERHRVLLSATGQGFIYAAVLLVASLFGAYLSRVSAASAPTARALFLLVGLIFGVMSLFAGAVAVSLEKPFWGRVVQIIASLLVVYNVYLWVT